MQLVTDILITIVSVCDSCVCASVQVARDLPHRPRLQELTGSCRFAHTHSSYATAHAYQNVHVAHNPKDTSSCRKLSKHGLVVLALDVLLLVVSLQYKVSTE